MREITMVPTGTRTPRDLFIFRHYRPSVIDHVTPAVSPDEVLMNSRHLPIEQVAADRWRSERLNCTSSATEECSHQVEVPTVPVLVLVPEYTVSDTLALCPCLVRRGDGRGR